MSKKIKVVVTASFVISIVLAVIYGRITAKSFVDDTNLDDYLSNENLIIEYCDIGYDENTNVGFVDGEKVNDIDDLIEADTVVVKAHLNKAYERQIYYECVLSEIEITQVYRGDYKEGDILLYFEPVDCICDEYMDCTDGYSLMQEDKEYVLFLKPLKNAGYGESEYVFAPVSTTYGKFLLSESKPKLYKEDKIAYIDGQTLYKDNKDEEIYLYDEGMYEKYCKLKEQARELVK
ncbi:MAG: hypothetical protein ACI4EF_01340 [Coprococcus sp.]